ncbi:MAG: hypothetical protein ACK46G_10760 [Flavobacteriales bacterium]|jgi:hypothetical protein
MVAFQFRWFTCLFLLMTVLPSAAQTTPATVVYGKVRQVSVAHNGSIWLTTSTGNIYHTASVDSFWQKGLQTNPVSDYSGLSTSFDRILFFSSDTAVLFGNIRCGSDTYERNCIRRTADGGRSWFVVRFGKEGAWVRHGQLLAGGVGYISASNGRIYRTSDHGDTWVTLPNIFGKEREAYYRAPDLWSFHFADTSTAIATNRSNHLAITINGFASAQRIATPLDQGLFQRVYKPYYLNGKGRKYVDNWNIDKVRIFGDHLLVLQNGRMYHTRRDVIAWKAGSADVLDFEVDDASGRLFAITADQGVGEFAADLSFTSWGQVNTGVRPLNIRVQRDVVYLLYATYLDEVGTDVVREHVAGLAVTEKNHKRVGGYHVFRATPEEIRYTTVRSH